MKDLEFLQQVLSHMGLQDAEVVEEERDGSRVLHIKVSEEDSGMVIGPRGEMVDALQRIVRMVVRTGSSAEGEMENPIIVDVNEYRLRREELVKNMAKEVAERVIANGQPEMLPFLRGYERRLVHLALENMEGIETRSDGEGRDRRLSIYPKGK